MPSKALWDYGTREHLEGIDLILSCGDLPQKYLEYLTNFTAAPILYVHGNHDGSYRENEPGGCICVDDSVYVWKGLRIMGLGGSQRYNKEDTYQYTEKAMRRRAHKLEHQAHKKGGIDLLLTHAPAKGLNSMTTVPVWRCHLLLAPIWCMSLKVIRCLAEPSGIICCSAIPMLLRPRCMMSCILPVPTS